MNLSAAARLSLAIWLSAGCKVLAQPATAPADADRPSRRFLLAGSDNHLWLAHLGQKSGRIFHRDAAKPFGLGFPVNGRVGYMVADDRALYVVVNDYQLYRYWGSETSALPQTNLPGGAAPLALAGHDGGVLAIISDIGAEALFHQAATQPAKPAPTGPVIVRHEKRAWRRVHGVPPALNPLPDGARLRLAVAADRLFVAWTVDDGARIETAFYAADGPWTRATTLETAGPRDVWLVKVNKQPVLVTAAHGSVDAFRLAEDPDTGRMAWRKTDLEVSSPLEGAAPGDVLAVTGFNQHLALLAQTGRQVSLRFARLDEPPLLSSISVTKVVENPQYVRRTYDSLTLITLLIVVLLMTGLFTWRRDAMFLPARLPAGYAPAAAIQRAAGFVVDFLPFMIAAAYAVDVSVSTGLQVLGAWAIAVNAETTLPPRDVVTWWTLSVVGYCLYATIMELIVGRTVGKLVVGIRLFSDMGQQPGKGQILARNAIRLIELAPPFWVLALMPVLSRNRQRVGDIFARTVPARLIMPIDRIQETLREARNEAEARKRATQQDEEQDHPNGPSDENEEAESPSNDDHAEDNDRQQR